MNEVAIVRLLIPLLVAVYCLGLGTREVVAYFTGRQRAREEEWRAAREERERKVIPIGYRPARDA